MDNLYTNCKHYLFPFYYESNRGNGTFWARDDNAVEMKLYYLQRTVGIEVTFVGEITY